MILQTYLAKIIYKEKYMEFEMLLIKKGRVDAMVDIIAEIVFGKEISYDGDKIKAIKAVLEANGYESIEEVKKDA